MSDNKETKQALAVIEAIASQWDGCMFPGIGHDIDIGASIRDAWKRLYEQAPAVEAGARDERAALIAERDAAIMSTHRQALCIQQCAAHIGPETSATIDGLPLAVKRVVRERDEALAALDGTPWQKDRASESAATDPTRERIAQALHYPDCWDTAAYPTLESAVWESVACAKLGCSECGGASEAAAGGKSHASDCAVHNEPAYPNGPCDCGVALREEAAQLKALANELRIEGLSELAAREPVAEVVIGWDASRPKTVKLLRAGEVLPIGTKLAAAPQPASEQQAAPTLDFATRFTPFGMLVRALRIVAGTTLYDMAKALLTTPAKLSAMEFGRAEVPSNFAFDVAAYFDALGVTGIHAALLVAILSDGSAQTGESK